MRASLLCLALLGACSGELEGPARVVDGDTIEVQATKVRLLDLDAPERLQTCTTSEGWTWACGARATIELRSLVSGHKISCRAYGKDKYGRTLAQCSVLGVDLGAWLVSRGWAVATSSLYQREMREAARFRRGMWSGSFQLPADYRRGQSLERLKPPAHTP